YVLPTPQATTTANITAKALTVTGVTANNKAYDGNTTATLNTSVAVLNGLVGADSVTVSGGTGTFADKNVGTGKAVTVSGITLGGTSAGNYTLTQPARLTANITVKTITVTGISANNKVYDGTTAATLNTGSSAPVGVVSGDAVTLNTA